MSITGVPAHSNAFNGPGYVCGGSKGVGYSMDLVINATSYVWSISSGSMSVISQTVNSNGTFCTVDFGNNFTTGVLTITTYNSCGSFSRNYVIQSVPLQPGGISGPGANLCLVSGAIYSISPVVGATGYTWSVPTGATIIQNTGTSITVNFGPGFTNTGNICVTANNACGSSVSRCYSVTARPAVPDAINGLASVCKSNSNVSYSINPVPGATSYSWSITGNAVLTPAGVNSTVNYNSANNSNATLKVSATNSCGTSQPSSKTIAINLSCRTADSQEETEGNESIRVYPNPSHGKANLSIEFEKDQDYIITVSDVTGKIIMTNLIHGKSGLHISELDLTGISKGVYVLSVQCENKSPQSFRLLIE